MKAAYKISASILLVTVIALAFFTKQEGSTADIAHKQYVCSMHPQVLRDTPGDCPICGMFLIEVMEQSGNSYDSSLADVTGCVNVTVSGSAGTLKPQRKTLPVIIEAHGEINFDSRKTQVISARFGGLVEKNYIKYEFQHVKKDQVIFEVFSPDIYNEKWNYVKLLQSYPDRDDLTSEALEWLKALGLRAGQIDSLKHSVTPDFHLPVYSPGEGYAVAIDGGLKEGSVIFAGSPLFRLVDDKSVRADIFIKTDYIHLLQKGQKVILKSPPPDESTCEAVIDLVDPSSEGIFRSVRADLKEIPVWFQAGRRFNALVLAGDREGIWVPASAIIETGHHNIVFLKEGNRFVATEVRTGIRSGVYTEILYGIDENSEIAIKPSLLIDSDGFISLK